MKGVTCRKPTDTLGCPCFGLFQHLSLIVWILGSSLPAVHQKSDIQGYRQAGELGGA